jgi:hypothetical protein
VQVRHPLNSFPQIMKHTCFNDTEEMHARLLAWRALFADFKPDLIICDHSPSALLAARGIGLPGIAVGNGFVVPPDLTPLPNLRPWREVDLAEMARDEALVLDRVNQVLGRIGEPPLDYLAQIFAANQQALFTFRELDNYAAERKDAKYWGPLYMQSGKAPEWPAGPGKRVFAYLQPFPTEASLLEILQAGGQPTLIFAPKLTPELRQRFEGGSLRFSDAPLDLPAVGHECDLAILHGGHGALSVILAMGKPMLLLPMHLEMNLNAMAVMQAGAALSAAQLRPEGMREKFQRLLTEPAFTKAAGDFAARYADLDIRKTPERFARRVEALLEA